MIQSKPSRTEESGVDESGRLIADAIEAARAGNQDEARELLRQAVEENPDSETAWLWRMSLARTKWELVECGERVLRINPRNQKALGWLRRVIGTESVDEVAAPGPQDPSAGERPLSGAGPVQLWSHPPTADGLTTGSAPQATADPVAAPQRSASGSPFGQADPGIPDAVKAAALRGRFSLGDVLPPKNSGPSVESSANVYRPRSVPRRVDRTDTAAVPAAPPQPIAARPTPSAATPPGRTPGSHTAPWACPLCEGQAEKPGNRCGRCGALLTLGDLNKVRTGLAVDHQLLNAAILRLQGVLEKGPDVEAHLRLAVTHLNLNQAAQAETHLSAALKLKPEDREIQMHLRALRDRRVVLVVDADEQVWGQAAAILEPYRIRVIHAGSGLQALSQVEQDMPDVILLNMKLPRMDGYEVCKILRKNAAAKDLPIIMLTETRGLVGKLRGRAAGVAGSVSKPLEPALLLRTLKKHLPDSYLPDPEMTGDATFTM